MMPNAAQSYRLPAGGLVDRARPLGFTFDGRRYQGFAGDTLASALLANGVRLVARSFKYHRPRGIAGIGAEEPSALVTVGEGATATPNLKATEVPLAEGLVARSQNAWPSLRFDAAALADRAGRVLPAGFYYKTFMRPARLWPAYERALRRMAGHGRAPAAPDPDRYARRFAHADVLVAGGGPAGLAAALAAAEAGARVLLASSGGWLGGRLLDAPAEIGGTPALEWVRRTTAALAARPEVRLLPATTVIGAYDHGLFLLRETPAAGSAAVPVAERIWWVRARRAVIATGAVERPMIFPDGDRPGVMLAHAVRGYLHRFGVLAGRRPLLFGDQDWLYPLALELARAGAAVAAVVDTREAVAGAAVAAVEAVRTAGIPQFGSSAVVGIDGVRQVRGALVGRLKGRRGLTEGEVQRFDCDLVASSAGFNPALQLHAQAGGRLAWDEDLALFRPLADPSPVAIAAGSANATFDLAAAIAEGSAAGASAAGAKPARPAGTGGRAPAAAPAARPAPALAQPPPDGHARPLWVISPPRRGKRFVDLQNDVTVEDIELAAREGYRSIEHVKRYTTLGMGTDQGRTGNVAGIAVLAAALGLDPPTVGVTTFRPPSVPVTVSALAWGAGGEGLRPVRRTPIDDWHAAHGAVWIEAAGWRRPRLYRVPGLDDAAAVAREVAAVRGAVGAVDASTLGKLDIRGADAAALLDLAYANRWHDLRVGRGRYGLMLREDGRVFDDGVTMRLGPAHFHMTTTTANAEAVYEHLEHLLQVRFPGLKVHVTPVTEQWCAVAIAGPKARALLFDLTHDIDVSREAFPMMAVREGHVAGLPARVFRVSYSGELSFEINVAADLGLALWNAVLAAGGRHGLVPYGTEAMGVLRIEKGIITHAEADGRTTPDDLGLARLVAAEKDFIGRRSLALPALADPGRLQLVGLAALEPDAALPEGSQLVAEDRDGPQAVLGRVTSHCRSPTLGRHIALALLADGRARIGATLVAASPLTGRRVAVQVVPPIFVDPTGERARG